MMGQVSPKSSWGEAYRGERKRENNYKRGKRGTRKGVEIIKERKPKQELEREKS